ncbi:glycosyltransferase family 2 protein [Candidatus Parcubacteria bacterium]|nr:MAG: glycosyltransferase family 2 protein [Candidatus Parcubacteria bacterium]
MKITVGLPAFNEEKNIGAIIARLMQEYDSVIVCDDGSSDMTPTIAQKMGAIVVSHQRNRGYGAAIQSLFSKAKEIDCDILVTFDADGQHKVVDIKKTIEPILKGNADIVIGSRFMDKNEKDVPKYREIGIKVITNLVNVESGKKITDAQSGFRAYSKKALVEITPSDSGMGVSTEILIKANQKKLRIAEVPITILYDGDTSTHNPVSHGTSVLLSTMKFISIEHPLKFYGIPGIIFLAIGLFFVVWTIQEFTETGRIITNISLIGIGSIIFGMMLMMNALMLYSLVNVVRERRS